MPNKLPFLPDEHHYAIAHVATRAAQLDHTIEISVDVLMGAHRRAAEHIIKNSDTNRLVGLLDALLRDKYPDRLSEIDSVMENLKTARKERNEVLHWIWSKSENEEEAHLSLLRIHREQDAKTKTAEDLYALADKLLRSSFDLTHLTFPDLIQLLALRDNPEPQAPPHHSASPEIEDRQEGDGLFGRLPRPSLK